jgi:hypothetical protein
VNAVEARPSRKKTKVTNASAMPPRKNCAAEFRKFVVWLRIIGSASRVYPATRLQHFGGNCGGGADLKGKHHKPPYSSLIPFDIGL